MLTSGNSSARASARGRVRLTMVISVHRLDAKCFTKSLDMVPAPTMSTFTPSNDCAGSFICTNSAAADDTDTAPLAMDVSLRTRFPAVIAALNNPVK